MEDDNREQKERANSSYKDKLAPGNQTNHTLKQQVIV